MCSLRLVRPPRPVPHWVIGSCAGPAQACKGSQLGRSQGCAVSSPNLWLSGCLERSASNRSVAAAALLAKEGAACIVARLQYMSSHAVGRASQQQDLQSPLLCWQLVDRVKWSSDIASRCMGDECAYGDHSYITRPCSCAAIPVPATLVCVLSPV